ncbi:MAG: CDP-diacylglycerol--glycerol-3-phosphate 3-phosphatidyltransferase [Icmadophila ericetorum]|nr:CDP-diacylglycerol--glycerol-3-phosphate 3-phosphatidyltransferase [Icmadophila ericetorum]
MLARRIAPCRAFQSSIKSSLRRPLPRRRTFSSLPVGKAQSPSYTSALSGITRSLEPLGPRIDINGDQITILEGPVEFYETLKTKIRGAKRRIFLSTLYIGQAEHELVQCLRETLLANEELQVSILTDYLRGTRESPNPSCASLLASLVAEFPDRVDVRMYHTSNLVGFKELVIPKRINEGWGLQHMKLYGFDDEVILSGANLSNDYFTNRQDRYYVFSAETVTQHFEQIHDTMCSLSFKLLPGEKNPGSYSLEWPEDNPCPSPLRNPKLFNTATTKIFTRFTEPPPLGATAPFKTSNTSIWPVFNLHHSFRTELPILGHLLVSPIPSGSSFVFTAGYFNPHPLVVSCLLSCAKGTPISKSAIPVGPDGQLASPPPEDPSRKVSGTVITAHPHANGFFGSKGVSGMLPSAYTLLSQKFLRAVTKHVPGKVELREWKRGTVGTPDGWTYHAKGLWLTVPASPDTPPPGPSVTIIGSSNYTTRSYLLDSEVGAAVLTTDEGLMKRLKAEQENLLKYAHNVESKDLEIVERAVSWRVKLSLYIVKLVGGEI